MNENTTNIDERLDVQKMLVVKLQGPKNAIIAFLHDLPKIVLESKMNISPILKNSGLNCLGISVDAFHLQFIPLKYPRNSAEAAVKAGIEKVTWNVAVLESLDGANHYDKLTNHILKELTPVGREAHVHKVSAAGRALRTMFQYFKKTPLDGPCEGETPMENTVKNPRGITIEPSGEVDICWHLSIGNAKETPLSQIINNYDWTKNPMTKTLAEEGPINLLKQHSSKIGRFEKSAYVNKCHLCTEVRRAIDSEATKQHFRGHACWKHPTFFTSYHDSENAAILPLSVTILTVYWSLGTVMSSLWKRTSSPEFRYILTS